MQKLTLAAILAFGLGIVGSAHAGDGGCAYGHGIKATKVDTPEPIIKTTTVTPPAEEPTDEPG